MYFSTAETLNWAINYPFHNYIYGSSDLVHLVRSLYRCSFGDFSFLNWAACNRIPSLHFRHGPPGCALHNTNSKLDRNIMILDPLCERYMLVCYIYSYIFNINLYFAPKREEWIGERWNCRAGVMFFLINVYHCVPNGRNFPLFYYWSKREKEKGCCMQGWGFLVVCVHSVCVSLPICVYMWLLPLSKFHSLNNCMPAWKKGNMRAKYTIDTTHTLLL